MNTAAVLCRVTLSIQAGGMESERRDAATGLVGTMHVASSGRFLKCEAWHWRAGSGTKGLRLHQKGHQILPCAVGAQCGVDVFPDSTDKDTQHDPQGAMPLRGFANLCSN